jgi:hypothetical protein
MRTRYWPAWSFGADSGVRLENGNPGGQSTSAELRIPWRDWGAEPFRDAAAASTPVFLSLQTSWCAWCRRMEAETFADERVVDLLSERVVPVRVDAERQPHVRDRYIGSGWPTNVFLTPSGGVLWSGPFVDAEDLLAAGRAVLEAWRERGPELEAELERRRAAVASARDRRSGSGMPRREAADDVLTFLQQTFDARNGGFGEAPKHPPVDAVAYLHLQEARLGAPELGEMADRTLDGILAGEMRDPQTGAFHRYALAEDWTHPSTERLLSVNAEIMRCFAAASAFRGRRDWADAATAAVAWAERALTRDDGLMAASVAADGDGRAGSRPARDDTAFADANATWSRCLAEAGVSLGRDDWVARAEDLFGLIRERFDRRGALPLHFLSPGGPEGPRGLLVDAVEILAAAISVAAASGSVSTLAYAQDLAERMREELWRDDGFAERAEGEVPGPLGPPQRPFHENAAAARALLGLDALAGAGGARSQAERILAFLSPAASRYGIDGAAFALAADEFFEPAPLAIVREATSADPSDAGRELTAVAGARPGARVWRLRENARVAGREFESAGPAAAWVRRAGGWTGPAHTSPDLRALLDR